VQARCTAYAELAQVGCISRVALRQSACHDGAVLRCALLVLAIAGCPADADPIAASTSTTGAAPVSYAACDDPNEGCGEADCRRVDDADPEGAWSICMPPCTEDADCPIGAGGNVQVVCEEGRCLLECVPQVLTCPSGTTCIAVDPPQCMWPAP
jgi:hypothetical protein